MSYRNKNTLLRMVEIQDLVLERKRHGITQLHVYKTESTLASLSRTQLSIAIYPIQPSRS